MTAGYSATPLPRKLGIKPGHRVLLLGAPELDQVVLAPGGQLGAERPERRVGLAGGAAQRVGVEGPDQGLQRRDAQLPALIGALTDAV